jgi:stringent starvation protein B
MTQTSAIVSTKPYLIRAIHEWCLDQAFTPYLVVKVDAHTRVPQSYVKDGQIVLNLGMEATHQLLIGNEMITFSARFNGVAQALSIPIDNVAAIYARENGQGMAFEVLTDDGVAVLSEEAESEVPESDAATASDSREPTPAPAGRSHLTRIK